MCRRLLVLLAIILCSSSLVAQTRARVVVGSPDNRAAVPMPGTNVSGLVSAVSGSIISLANGLVTIDASAAKIIDANGAATTVSAIPPGAIIFAVLQSADSAPNAPLPAAIIAVTRTAQVTLSGPVQAVDVIGATVTLLGRTIHITADTSFGGGLRVARLADILTNQIVQVQANAVAGSLVASSVLLFAPTPLPSTLIHGTVKTISADTWVITDRSGRDVKLSINSQTRIIGDPKVGDTVDVLASVDPSGMTVALSIMKSPPPPPTTMHVIGTVSSINGAQWTISPGPPGSMAPVFLVLVNSQTKIVGDPKVGDRVDVLGEPGSGGFVAISITKL